MTKTERIRARQREHLESLAQSAARQGLTQGQFIEQHAIRLHGRRNFGDVAACMVRLASLFSSHQSGN